MSILEKAYQRIDRISDWFYVWSADVQARLNVWRRTRETRWSLPPRRSSHVNVRLSMGDGIRQPYRHRFPWPQLVLAMETEYDPLAAKAWKRLDEAVWNEKGRGPIRTLACPGALDDLTLNKLESIGNDTGIPDIKPLATAEEIENDQDAPRQAASGTS